MTQLFSKSWSEFLPTRLEVKSWFLQRQWTLSHCKIILCHVQQEAADALRVFPPTPPAATFTHCKWTGKVSWEQGGTSDWFFHVLYAALELSCMLHGYKCNFKPFHYNTDYLRNLKILSALLYYSKVVFNVYFVCVQKKYFVDAKNTFNSLENHCRSILSKWQKIPHNLNL